MTAAEFWTDLHGGVVHFPIALSVMAAACEGAAALFWDRPVGARLRDAGGWALAAAGLGTLPAAASGLMLSRGDLLGSGALRWHHAFAWPLVALLVGAAVWRILVRRSLTRRSHAAYAAVLGAAALVACAAGYWGGELLKAYP
jgi:uncharacterized membrane protein